ncbi:MULTISPECIES: hypothetical protein [unclassified Kitasatospora]|uniref:hypothetical protein n=1 Tax=unclassified Kitasatospora TaxID=2633591 RepID=UPI00071025C9|nr:MULTISPECIES: hypothetical protein [unclassified Kitasatospora]KQV18795.1 hypothetical protein ASC99_06290 [Kitasatospora sp. Root107]KRB74777.1 hypothetical protein ASE03_20225 [Kitasatospora sp. Root187]
MTKRSTGKMTKLRRGTQELLQRRGMVADPGPQPPMMAGHAMGADSGPRLGDAAFSHGGRRSFAAPAMQGGPAHHAELPGHRHRGAEKHSAH